MKKVISLVLAAVAMVASNAASIGCNWLILDEPEAPKSFRD